MEKNNTPVKEKEVLNDYEATPVPDSEHMSWLSQGAVWIGASFCLAAIQTGGILANGLSFGQSIIAILVGSAILTVLAIFMGIVGAQTHLASAMNSRFSLGIKGSKIFGIVVAFSLFGWFGFQADMFGQTVVTLLEGYLGIHTAPQVVWTIIGGTAMMITAIVGYKGIKALSNVAVPLLFVLAMAALGITLARVPFASITSKGPVGVAIPLTVGIASVVGNNAVSVVIVSDFTRYSKTRKDAIRGCILGYFFGYVPILLMGAIFTYSFNNWNIVEVMLGELNLGIVAAIVLILAQWTTNDNNLYSSVLGVANVLAGTRIKYKRWLLTLIVGIISIAFSAIGLVDHYLSFLSILTATIPAMAGVVISDFFFLNKNDYEFELIEKKKLADWNWSGIISWFLAIFMGLCMTAAPTGLGVPALVKLAGVVPTPIVGVIVAFVCNMVIYPLFNKRAAKG